MYEKSYFKFSHSSEVTNGIYIFTGIEYANRHPLDNATDDSWHQNRNIEYTKNNPPTPDAPILTDHKALIFTLSARFTINQKYFTYPNRKITFGSNYPIISVNYKKGIPTIFYSSVDFDYLSVKAEKKLDLKKLGEASIALQMGTFLRSVDLSFADYKHFNGNRTIFTRQDIQNRFMLLDYYTYSTNGVYAEAHWEHHLNGFITNRIPLLKKLNWQLVNSFNYLYTNRGNYVEGGLGFEHIFKYFRLDYAIGYHETGAIQHGVRVGLGF